MNEEEPQNSFLNRWSNRKRDAATQTAVPDEEVASAPAPFSASSAMGAESTALAESEPSAEQSEQTDTAEHVSAVAAIDADEPLLTDADMPAIESLTADSDVSAFFNKGVSAALRKAALRYVFQQPKFNIRDGLNDYDGDYTVFEPLGDTITSDMKFHAARLEKDRLAAEAEAERAEELLRQEQLSVSEEEESQAVSETETETDTSDSEQIDNDAATDEEPASDGEGGTSDEVDSQSELTTLAHADSDDAKPQRASMLVEKTEQV